MRRRKTNRWRKYLELGSKLTKAFMSQFNAAAKNVRLAAGQNVMLSGFGVFDGK
jgi:hypothetical protein